MMQTIIQGRQVRTTLDRVDRAAIRRLLRRLGPHAQVPALGEHRQLSSEDLWWRQVEQVCVMGSARGMEALRGDASKVADLKEKTSLRALKRTGFDRNYLSDCLMANHVTRFHQKAADRLMQLAQTPTVVRGNRVVLLNNLPRPANVEAVREELMARTCQVFRRKSISDFMIAVGLSHDVIALDQRVVGELRRYLHYNLPFGRVQGSKSIYLSVEAALREVCEAAESSLAVLDRTLFQFEVISAVEFVMNMERG